MGKCSDTQPCCEGMQCVDSAIGEKWCKPIPGPCVAEGKRAPTATACCVGLKAFADREQRTTCLKLGEFSNKNEVCSSAQKCAAGLFCKNGNCDTLPTCRQYAQSCGPSDEDKLGLGCCGDMKCVPYFERNACARLPACAEKYSSCDQIPCCVGMTCETETNKHTGKLVKQCRPVGQTAAREATCNKKENEDCNPSKDRCCNGTKCEKFMTATKQWVQRCRK
jgi:hypothetical protein